MCCVSTVQHTSIMCRYKSLTHHIYRNTLDLGPWTLVLERGKCTAQFPHNQTLTYHHTRTLSVHSVYATTSLSARPILTKNSTVRANNRIGFVVTPVDDNIFNWTVKLFNLRADVPLAQDLANLDDLHG